MSDTQQSGSEVGGGNRAGIYLAVLQLVLTLGWTTYAIYLPKLAASVGIAPTAVIVILMMDQAIFTVTDTAMGLIADRISRVVGQLGIFVGALTAVSCICFIAMPFVARQGPQAQSALIGLIIVWSMTSSALRAPPLTLLGKYAARPAQPFLAALAMLGYGLAGAAAPYLGTALRDIDARLPFAISSLALLVIAIALSRVERGLVQVQRRAARPPTSAGKAIGPLTVGFIAGMVVLALGFQLHFSINSAPLFLRFATTVDLEWLMPVFWVGFNIAMFPASAVVKRQGGLIVLGGAALLGALAIVAAEYAAGLNVMIVAQFLAGAAWGCMMMSAVSAAMALGETGAEGKAIGLVFSALALATFARMAAVAGGLQKMPDYAALVQWAPVACWAVAGVGLLSLSAVWLQRR